MRPILAAILLVFATSASALPDGTDPPALREDSGYLTNVEVAVFNGPLEVVKATMETPEGGVLAFVDRTDRIAGIAELTPLTDMFPNEGAVRRVALTDGSHVVERVLEHSDTRFSYQIWDFTSPSARALSHIVGSFEYEAIGPNETRVTWTYSVAPRLFLARPFVRSFLNNDFVPFMESGLQGAASAYNAAALN